jgi:toxin ParE1/3/4
MLPIIISPKSENDISNAYVWYEKQSPGLGDEFILCLDAILHRVARSPQIFQVVHKDIRRGILKRFPYGVFFCDRARPYPSGSGLSCT